VVFGMTIATACGIFIIPVCYGFVQGLAEKFGRAPAPTKAPSASPTTEKGGH